MHTHTCMRYIYIPTVARIFFVIKIIFIVTFFHNCYFPLQSYDTIVSFEKVSFYNIIEKNKCKSSCQHSVLRKDLNYLTDFRELLNMYHWNSHSEGHEKIENTNPPSRSLKSNCQVNAEKSAKWASYRPKQ